MTRNTVEELVHQWGRARPGMDVSALGVVVRLQLLAKLLGRRANRALKRHGLKHWEYDVLTVLRRQGKPCELPASEIARAAHLTSGAMTTRIDGLEERGLVRRRQSRRDGRSVLVRLTAEGARVADRALMTRLADAEAVLAGLTSRERRHLDRQLAGLLEAIEGTPGAQRRR